MQINVKKSHGEERYTTLCTVDPMATVFPSGGVATGLLKKWSHIILVRYDVHGA